MLTVLNLYVEPLDIMCQPFCARSSLVNNHTIKYQTVKCSEISPFASAKPDCKDHTGPIHSSLKACLVGRNWSKETGFKSVLNKVPAKLGIAAWLTSANNINPAKNCVCIELYSLSPSIYFLGRMKF